MAKKSVSPRKSHLTSQELVQLNAAHAEAALAKERFHHWLTKGHLLRAMHDVARLQNEVNQHKQAESSRVAADQHLRAEKEALEHRQAKDKIVTELAESLRTRYSVGEKFAIDPFSGEFLDPEA